MKVGFLSVGGFFSEGRKPTTSVSHTIHLHCRTNVCWDGFCWFLLGFWVLGTGGQTVEGIDSFGLRLLGLSFALKEFKKVNSAL